MALRGEMMHTTLDASSAAPLYKQLVYFIKNDIVSGRLKPGGRIPSEAELSGSYGISRITVRTAIAELVKDGLLVKKQGKGTFVAANNARDVHQFISFTQSARMQGMVPSARVLSAATRPGTGEEIEALELSEGSDVVCIRRLRFADNRPVSYERTVFSPEYAYLIDMDLSGSLYDTIKETRGVVPMHSYSLVELHQADAEEAELLGLKAGDAIMQHTDLVYDQQRKPLHLSKQAMGPGFKFHV